jgi:hypothetical protein
VNTDITERVLTDPPASGQTFVQKCVQDNKCGGKTLGSAYDVVVTVSGNQQHRTACECVTPQISTSLAKQASGDTTCSATCEASCRNQGFAVNTAVKPTVVQTGCITDADCKIGVFAKFKGVSCKPSTDATGKVTYGCSIPVTGDVGKQNANIECANYAGSGMNGATCDFVAAGDSPSSYLMTRPYFQSDSNGALTYKQQSLIGTSYTTPDALWRALDQLGGISTTPGICYLYGTGEADYTRMDVASALVNGVTNSKRYVCVKRKISVCGGALKFDDAFKAATYPSVKNPFRYSCVPRSTYDANTSLITRYCLTGASYQTDSRQIVNAKDLCSVPNQLCCATSCTINAECGPYKVCSDGQCIPKTECNPDNSAWRCRTPSSPAEAANPSSCLPTLTTPLCQIPGNQCCAPSDPTSAGSCAIDLQSDFDFHQHELNANTSWKNFTCLTPEQLSSGNQQLISDWKTGGDCILGDVAIKAGESKAVSRCGVSKRCCDITKLAPALKTELDQRPPINTSPCGTDLANSRCIDPNAISGDLERYAIQDAGFDSLDSYLSALGASGACRATPVNVAGSPLNTMECASGSLCCYAGLKACDPAAPNCSAGEACHPQLRVCVPSSTINQKISGSSCADQTNADVQFIAKVNGVQSEDFTCQVVNASDSLVTTKCVAQGCTAPNGQAIPDGKEYRCCVPGVGESSAVVAQGTGVSSTAATSPSTIGLSSCIRSGQCGLDDILVTAANFANFLFKISGAFFLGIFVYAGFLYLTAGSSDRGKKGLTMIKQSVTGLILLFAGYILINFIQSSFVSTASNSSTTSDICGTTNDTLNMSCQFLPVDEGDEKGISEWVGSHACVRGKCGGPKNRICCPSAVSR